MKRIMSNFGLKLASLVFAAVIWFSVTNTQDPQTPRTIRDVAVTIKDESHYMEEQKLVGWAVDASDLKQNVKVIGKKSLVDSLTKEDIKLVVDLKNMPVKSNNSTVRVIPIEASIDKNAGADSIDIELTNDKLEYNVENKRRKKLDLKPTSDGQPDDKYTVGNMTSDLDRIEIEGPESVVNSVKTAAAVVDVSGLTRSMNVNANIVLYDVKNQPVETSDVDASRVKVVNNSGKLTVRTEVEILETKYVPIKCNVTGEPASGYEKTEIKCEPDKVQIAGDPKVISKINDITISDPELDVTGSTQEFSYPVDLDKYLPEGVRFASQDFKGKATVVVGISKSASKNFAVDLKNITVENPVQGYDVKIDTDEYESVALTLLGMDAALAAVDESSLKGTVDATQLIKENGADGIRDGVYSARIKWTNLPDGVKIADDAEVYVRVRKTN